MREPPEVLHEAVPIDLAYEYRQCRAYGHAWWEVPSDWTPELGVPFTLRCERCGTERRDTVHRDWGVVMSRRYQYPEGYTYSADELVTPRRIDFLLDVVKRWNR